MLAIFTMGLFKIYFRKPRKWLKSRIGTLLAHLVGIDWTRRVSAMYDRDFFASKLGLAALVSIAAMVTFNVYALTHQYGMTTEEVLVVAPVVELA
jgi:hypothetical protein